MTYQERIDGLKRHQATVKENCEIIAEKLSARGEIDMARALYKVAQVHDNSKFSGIEWTFLTDPHVTNRAGLKYAIEHHQQNNPHHPEYWVGGIKQMPLVYKYEMIADISARSTEQGTSVRDYLDNIMPKKYGFDKNGSLHTELIAILDMLVSKPFEPVEDPTVAVVAATPGTPINPS